jgi:hypothetical protein
MGIQWQHGGYSAEVEIHLVVEGRRFAVSHIGPDSLILRDEESVPNGHAQIIIKIDGREEVHDVIIHAADSTSELAFA